MKKIIIILSMIVLYSGHCFAMHMSQPVKIGSATGSAKYAGKILPIEGANFIIMEERHGTQQFVKAHGGAKFGNGESALWLNYLGANKAKFGGMDIKKSVCDIDLEETYVRIYKITTDIGITLYAICKANLVCDWVLLGYIGNNTFVKYFDTEDITKQYFRNDYLANNGIRKFYYYGNFIRFDSTGNPFEVNGDTIKINLKVSDRADFYEAPITGSFFFKWDEQAKWFSVEYLRAD